MITWHYIIILHHSYYNYIYTHYILTWSDISSLYTCNVQNITDDVPPLPPTISIPSYSQEVTESTQNIEQLNQSDPPSYMNLQKIV